MSQHLEMAKTNPGPSLSRSGPGHRPILSVEPTDLLSELLHQLAERLIDVGIDDNQVFDVQPGAGHHLPKFLAAPDIIDLLLRAACQDESAEACVRPA